MSVQAYATMMSCLVDYCTARVRGTLLSLPVLQLKCPGGE